MPDENLEATINSIFTDSALSLERRIACIKQLELPEERLKELLKKLKEIYAEQWLTLDSSLQMISLSTSSAETLSPERSVSVGKIQIHRGGDESDYTVSFPLNEKIYSRELCQAFEVAENQECQIVLNYKPLCTLSADEHSHFIPIENGDYIIIFQCEEAFNHNPRMTAARLKVLDKKAGSVLAVLQEDLFSLIDFQYHEDLKFFIEAKRWNFMKQWMADKFSVESQQAFTAFLEESERVSPSPFNFANNPKQEVENQPKSEKESNPSDSTVMDDSLVGSGEPPVVAMSLLDKFLSHYDDDEEQKKVIISFINLKKWKIVQGRVKNEEDPEKERAFNDFFEDYKANHLDEFPKEEEEVVKQSPPTATDPQSAPTFATKPVEFEKNLLDFDEPLTVLLLGETGVGKSTFVNSFANYLKYTTMSEARLKKPVIVLPVAFDHQDEDYNSMRIKCSPSIDSDNKDQENEKNLKSGNSCTQHAKTYLFQVGPEPRQAVRFIDTPGVGDTRGKEVEDKNFSDILGFISNYKKIDAILILMKPDKPRLSVTFTYCIEELLTHLHISALQNIIFCFTNTQATNYHPGNSFLILEKYLNDLNSKKGLTGDDAITVSTNNVFCFDNEPFRCLCSWVNGVVFKENEIEIFKKSWKASVKENFRLLKRIRRLNPHDTSKTLSINNIRNAVFIFSKPLAKITEILETNIEIIKRREDELKALEANEAVLKAKDKQMTLIVPNSKELPMPVTVCTNESCTTLRVYNRNDDSRFSMTDYSTKCHISCLLKNVQTETIPNNLIQNCSAFVKHGINQCVLCGCDWSKHMHIRYEVVEETQTVENEVLLKELENCTNAIQEKEAIIEDLKRQREEMKTEKLQINNGIAELVAYLRKHSLSPYNDVFREYTVQLIKEEKKKVRAGDADTVLKQMEQSLLEYDELVIHFGKVPAGHASEKTIAQINDIINDIREFKHCKELLKKVATLELLSIKNEQQKCETNVPLKGGWVYNHMKENY